MAEFQSWRQEKQARHDLRQERKFHRALEGCDSLLRVLGSHGRRFNVPAEDMESLGHQVAKVCWDEARQVMHVDTALQAAKEESARLRRQLSQVNLTAMKQLGLRDGQKSIADTKLAASIDELVTFYDPLVHMDSHTRDLILTVVCDKVEQLKRGTAPDSFLATLYEHIQSGKLEEQRKAAREVQLSSMPEDVATLQERLADAEATVQEAEDQMKAYEEKASWAVEQAQEAQLHLREMKLELSGAEAKAGVLEAQLVEEHDGASEELEDLRRSLVEERSLVARLREETSQHKQEAARLQFEVSGLRSEHPLAAARAAGRCRRRTVSDTGGIEDSARRLSHMSHRSCPAGLAGEAMLEVEEGELEESDGDLELEGLEIEEVEVAEGNEDEDEDNDDELSEEPAEMSGDTGGSGDNRAGHAGGQPSRRSSRVQGPHQRRASAGRSSATSGSPDADTATSGLAPADAAAIGVAGAASAATGLVGAASAAIGLAGAASVALGLAGAVGMAGAGSAGAHSAAIGSVCPGGVAVTGLAGAHGAGDVGGGSGACLGAVAGGAAGAAGDGGGAEVTSSARASSSGGAPAPKATAAEQAVQTRVTSSHLDEQEAEVKRLRVALEELQMKLKELVSRLQEQGMGEKLIEVLEGMGLKDILRRKNCFERLYEDAQERVYRLELLREKVRKERRALLNLQAAEALERDMDLRAEPSVLCSVEQSRPLGSRRAVRLDELLQNPGTGIPLSKAAPKGEESLGSTTEPTSPLCSRGDASPAFSSEASALPMPPALAPSPPPPRPASLAPRPRPQGDGLRSCSHRGSASPLAAPLSPVSPGRRGSAEPLSPVSPGRRISAAPLSPVSPGRASKLYAKRQSLLESGLPALARQRAEAAPTIS